MMFCWTVHHIHSEILAICKKKIYQLTKMFEIYLKILDICTRKCGKIFNKKFWYTYMYTKTILLRHFIGHFIMSLYILLYKFHTHWKSWMEMYSEWTHLNVWWEISNHISLFENSSVFELYFPVTLLQSQEDNHCK